MTMNPDEGPLPTSLDTFGWWMEAEQMQAGPTADHIAARAIAWDRERRRAEAHKAGRETQDLQRPEGDEEKSLSAQLRSILGILNSIQCAIDDGEPGRVYELAHRAEDEVRKVEKKHVVALAKQRDGHHAEVTDLIKKHRKQLRAETRRADVRSIDVDDLLETNATLRSQLDGKDQSIAAEGKKIDKTQPPPGWDWSYVEDEDGIRGEWDVSREPESSEHEGSSRVPLDVAWEIAEREAEPFVAQERERHQANVADLRSQVALLTRERDEAINAAGAAAYWERITKENDELRERIAAERAAREKAQRDAAGEREVRRQAEERMNEAEAARDRAEREVAGLRSQVALLTRAGDETGLPHVEHRQHPRRSPRLLPTLEDAERAYKMALRDMTMACFEMSHDDEEAEGDASAYLAIARTLGRIEERQSHEAEVAYLEERITKERAGHNEARDALAKAEAAHEDTRRQKGIDEEWIVRADKRLRSIRARLSTVRGERDNALIELAYEREQHAGTAGEVVEARTERDALRAQITAVDGIAKNKSDALRLLVVTLDDLVEEAAVSIPLNPDLLAALAVAKVALADTAEPTDESVTQ